MRILLPPSEGKTAPATGAAVELAALFAPDLTSARQQVADALATLCGADPEEAAAALKLGKRQHDDLAANRRLTSAPAAPASTVYTGVLYEALNPGGLPPRARDRARRQVMIFSGLWGVLRLDDRIPYYRCPAGAKLRVLDGDKPTGLGTFWRRRLDEHLPRALENEFVLDLRSGPYQAMWRPCGRHASVRVLHERLVNGETRRSVVSHFNKATKGRIAADLLADAADPASVPELITALRDLKHRVEPNPTQPAQLDVVVSEL
ncbi:MAG: YaaA family protein [Stackebrandtia sp.]